MSLVKIFSKFIKKLKKEVRLVSIVSNKQVPFVLLKTIVPNYTDRSPKR